MDFATAEKINGATLEWALYKMGIIDHQPESIKEYSLRELIEARDVVNVANDEAQKATDGPRTIHTVCDDRAIAAVYVATHYESQPNGSDDIEPIVLISIDGNKVACLALVSFPKPIDEDDELKNRVLAYMRVNADDCETATNLAEWAADEFDHHEWCDDPDHWVWELALNAKPEK